MSTEAELASRLRSAPLFASLSDERLAEISAMCVSRTVHAGDVIFREGDRGESLYVLLTGSVSVERHSADGESSVRLVKMQPPACFGEMSLFDGAPRSASVIALSECELLELSGAALMPLCRMHNELYESFLKILTRRLRQMDSRLSG